MIKLFVSSVVVMTTIFSNVHAQGYKDMLKKAIKKDSSGNTALNKVLKSPGCRYRFK
jgi:hypothetical protein